MGDILLVARWVLPIDKKPIEHGAIAVIDGKIADVGPVEAVRAAHPKLPIREFPRGLLMPGFVDLHTHLEFSVLRGTCDDLSYTDWKIQLTKKTRVLSEADWLISAELGALEALRSGITTIADVTHLGASRKAAAKAGLRGRIYYEIVGMDHNRVSQDLAAAKEAVAEWQDITKDSRLSIGVAPHSPYAVCPPLLQAVSAWAAESRLPTCIHLAGSSDEFDFIKYGSGPLAGAYRDLMGWDQMLWQPTGVSPVRYVEKWGLLNTDLLAVHCVQVDRADIDTLEHYDAAVAHCPKCSAKLGMGIAPVESFVDHKLRLGIGTDSPASNNTMDFFDEMRVGVLLQRGVARSSERMSAETFLKLATIGGAKALRWQKQVGSLKPGKEADIIAIGLSSSHQVPISDPFSALVYTANQEHVLMTMVGGDILYDSGRFMTLDEEAVIAKSTPVREKVGARV